MAKGSGRCRMDKASFRNDIMDFMSANGVTIKAVARMAGVEPSSMWRFMKEDERELMSSAVFAIMNLVNGNSAGRSDQAELKTKSPVPGARRDEAKHSHERNHIRMAEEIKGVVLPAWLAGAIDCADPVDLGNAVKSLFADFTDSVKHSHPATYGELLLYRVMSGAARSSEAALHKRGGDMRHGEDGGDDA